MEAQVLIQPLRRLHSRQRIQPNARVTQVARGLQSGFCEATPQSRAAIAGAHVQSFEFANGRVDRPHGDAARQAAFDLRQQQDSARRPVHPRKSIQFLRESLKAQVDPQAGGIFLKQGAGLSKVGVGGGGADDSPSYRERTGPATLSSRPGQRPGRRLQPQRPRQQASPRLPEPSQAAAHASSLAADWCASRRR